MTEHTNRCLRLRARPTGRVSAGDLELCHEPVPEPGPGQAVIRTLFLSLDPTNRIWMSDMDQYMPPVELGEVMRGLGVGEVVASERDDLPVGALAHGVTGWQEYAVADPADPVPFTALPAELPVPPSAALGVLGITGMTAYFGIEDIGRPQPGETVVISAAAGAVGSVAGQIAKARGARVVGIAGTAQKCAMVVDELGFDACVCHRD